MTGPRYSARPWRARFIRSPKVALELAERRDFVALAEIAELRLGLKTGADDFFYVVPTKRPPKQEQAALPGMAIKATLHVKGLSSWEGEIPKKDLRPAIRNPHELLNPDGSRSFSIPKTPIAYYVYPRDRRPQQQLDEYVLLAEKIGVSRQKLVVDNASNHWYRQARTLVESRWALPYNSAYDYGAWDNAVAAVLNGRFVGADPRVGVDADLLGAALNSTFAMAGRLLEGVATGVEGALDVGPPAARRIMVPDARKFSDHGSDHVKVALDAFRQANRMPPGPQVRGDVDRLRAKLDTSLLVALGLSEGQAAALLDRLYESYRRWRSAVEDVERQMRVYRSQMSRSGQARTSRKSPEEVGAHEIWEIIQADTPRLPFDLLLDDESTETVELVRTAHVPADRPLFDETKVMLPNGRSIDLGSWERVRYLRLLKDIGFHSPFTLPTDAVRSGAIVDQFSEAKERLTATAREMSTTRVGRDGRERVVELVVEQWLKSCREAGMVPTHRTIEGDGGQLADATG